MKYFLEQRIWESVANAVSLDIGLSNTDRARTMQGDNKLHTCGAKENMATEDEAMRVL